jgi:hypothetical protein
MSSSSPRFAQRAQTSLSTTKIGKNTEIEFDELSRNVTAMNFNVTKLQNGIKRFGL